VGLLAAAAIYLRGWWALRAKGFTLLAHPALVVRHLGGVAALVAALCSPVESWQRHSLAAHMVQHELLMIVAAPLLLAARPLPVGLWGLPGRIRIALGRALARDRPLRRWLDSFLTPAPALATSVGVLWAWHLPSLYNGVQSSRVLHDLQHLSFFASGLLLWWPIVRAAPWTYRWAQLEGVLYGLVAYLLVGSTLRSLPGAYFVLSDTPVYDYYIAQRGPQALQDQRLAGAIMWGVPLPLFLAAALSAVWGGRNRSASAAALSDPGTGTAPVPLDPRRPGRLSPPPPRGWETQTAPPPPQTPAASGRRLRAPPG
jgi:cytochrome c oxidase assembly factor CtaG